MSTHIDENDKCCPEFEPSFWDDKLTEWDNKKFIKDKVYTFFYMPLNFGRVMKRLDEKVRKSDAEMSDFLCLSDHTSMWNMDVYLAVNKDIKDGDNTSLSGKVYSKVYEGSFNETGKWMKDFNSLLKSKGHQTKKTFMWYTTCPKCAKKYGKNYVVILALIE